MLDTKMEKKQGSSKKRGKLPSDRVGLADIIFSWSLEDIENENLFQVEKIPETFISVQHYLSSFELPLLEETRAQLHSSMDTISEAPYAEVISFSESKPYGIISYEVKIDCWRNRSSCGGKESYNSLPGDILLLADFKPETAANLERVGMAWCLALVSNIVDDDNEDVNTSTHFKVRLSKDVNAHDQKSLFVIYLMNITTSNRIWKALDMHGNLKVIKEVLHDYKVGKSCSICSTVRDEHGDEELTMSLQSRLNESQTQAVLNCLHKIQCDHMPCLELIWGPPGTGKTKTISTMLFTLMGKKFRTLMCAPSNIAITEIASRVLKLVMESHETEYGTDALFYPLGDILLFGNKERLKITSELEEIYLDYRVKMLTECFATITGWWNCFTSVIEFLEDCTSQFSVFLENELLEDQNQKYENDNKVADSKDDTLGSSGRQKSFLEFARERFSSTTSPLKRCVLTLCTHLPISVISKCNVLSMLSVISLLDSFGSLLFHDDIVSEDLKEHFSQPDLVMPSSHGATDVVGMLCLKRVECLSLLKFVRQSLKCLNLPSALNQGAIEALCFKKSTLIFCTASSSFKLHSWELEPIKLLIIDEAAQLKECESTIALQLPGIRHAIIIGDECQLPATVESKVSNGAGFGRSLFERLSSLHYPKHLLNMQYRMHPAISCFPNSLFYNNEITDAPSVESENHEKQYLPGPMFGPYSFINVFGGREEHGVVGPSWRNMVEVAIVTKLLQLLYKAWSRSRDKLSIGVISPYAAQVETIRDKLGKKYGELNGFSVKVKSIDGFQGGEEDIIILSTVRSNRGGAIGFMSDSRRANVALTRARHCLWILGNERTLASSDSVWELLIHDAKERHCFFDADEDRELGNTIMEIKKELDQLDDLLHANSELFRNTRWKVLFSECFKKSFQGLASVGIKASVLNVLLKLSNGWRPKKRNVAVTCGSCSQILRQFKVEGLYIICSIDIVRETRYTQVLKVWDVLPLEDIRKLVKRLDGIFERYTDDFVSRCKQICLEGDLEVPKTWSTSFDIARYKSVGNDRSGSDSSPGDPVTGCYVENSRVSDSLVLMKFYSLSRVPYQLLLKDDGRGLELPFEVTDKENEIILFERSTFILGRSGTGKTTVLTMKLFAREELHTMAVEGFDAVSGNPPKNSRQRYSDHGQTEGAENSAEEAKKSILRQLFVTVSPKLCHAIRHHVLKLKSFAYGGKFSADDSSIDMEDIDDNAQFKHVSESFVDIPPQSYPLVVSFHKFLMMLDKSVGNSYFERFPAIRPLLHGEKGNPGSIFVQSFIRTREVNYDKFCTAYWPHFNSKFTRNLDSSRVFTEIMSHIKGGLQAGTSSHGKLSKEEYVELAEGRVSMLSRDNREMIYQIYRDYENMKKENGDFDLGDLVIDLHSRLKNEKYEGDIVDFVYIDEVQDLTMRQIALFKHICKNVDEGFVFSGDTAQTIARGIDFRFEDIRSLFYCEFVLGSRSDDGRKEKGQISKTFHLSQNFRTHAGVLHLAQSVVDLLYRFFPLSVDILSPETSLIFGEAPILLDSGNKENAILTIFGNNGNRGNTFIGFGADQVILVRDEAIRKEIIDYVGKQALVLTILECKGLEFQDVLLYNFFGTSPLKNKWRVVYQYMNEQDLLDASSLSIPCFDMAKHNILCSELKYLYVAITRTRQRLWICENKQDFSEPMFEYWKSRSLVQVRKLDDSLAQAMQVASTPEEWKSQGYKLLREGNYEMATVCFERAGDQRGEKLAKAAGLKATADRMDSSNPEKASIARRQAAEIFESIGKTEYAAECFHMLKEYEKAGSLYLQCGESSLGAAGECFYLAGRFELAAEVFFNANHFSKCLSACNDGKLFDLGLKYIQSRKQLAASDNQMEKSSETEKCEHEFLENSALYYHGQNDKRSMMLYVRTFNAIDSRRNFLKHLRCYDELILLEEELGNFLDAANIAKLKGDLLLGADLLGKAGHYKDASILILRYVLANSLWSAGSKGWPLKQFPRKDEILNRGKSFAREESDEWYKFVHEEAEILRSCQSSLFSLKQQLDASQSRKSIHGEILMSWRILDAHFQVVASKYSWDDDFELDLAHSAAEKLSKNYVSGETLIYFWNLWKHNIMCIFEYLGHADWQDIEEYRSCAEFCLNYLGIRREFQNSNSVYVLLNPGADWLRVLDSKFLRSATPTSIGVQQFVSAARSYWSSELLSVGMKVLASFDSLYNFSVKNSLSLFCQSKSLTYIYEVAKFLLHSKLLDHQNRDNRTLQKFIGLSTENFFNNAYPLEWRQSLKENMIYLRRTKSCEDLLDDVVLDYVSSKNNLSCGQLGRMALIMLGFSKLRNEAHEKNASGMKCREPWKALIMHLCRKQGTQVSPQDDSAVPCEVSLKSMLHNVLVDTYNLNWLMVQDYISPGCFLYLVERQLILLSYFRGFFLSTKSSVVEWLFYHNRNDSQIYSLMGQEPQSTESTLMFIVDIVRSFLYSKRDSMAWIRKSHRSIKGYYGAMVLRMVVILCLVFLNFGLSRDLFSDLLQRDYITQVLPRDFRDALCKSVACMSYNSFDVVVNVLAEGFKFIGNPLATVSLGGDCTRFRCPNILFIDVRRNQSTEELLRVLFPKFKRIAQGDRENPKNASGSWTGEMAPKDSVQGKMPNLHLPSPNLNPGCDISHQQLLNLFGALGFLKGGERRSLVLDDKFRLALGKAIHFLSTAADSYFHKNLLDCEDSNLFEDTGSTIEELQQLYALLDVSEPKVGAKDAMIEELGAKDAMIEELLGRLQARGPRMESFLNQIFSQLKENPDASPTKDQPNGQGDDEDDGDNKAEDTSCNSDKEEVNASQAGTSQGIQSNKGQSKTKNKKNKKGKRGRNKK